MRFRIRFDFGWWRWNCHPSNSWDVLSDHGEAFKSVRWFEMGPIMVTVWGKR